MVPRMPVHVPNIVSGTLNAAKVMMTLVDSKLSAEKRGFLHATTRIFIPALQTAHDEKRFP